LSTAAPFRLLATITALAWFGVAQAEQPDRGPAPKPTGGPVLVGAGSLVAALGLVAALDQRSQAVEIFEHVEQDPGSYDDSLPSYQRARRGMTTALLVAGIGGAIAVTGIPVWVGEARQAREGAAVAIAPVVVPGSGAGVWIEGRW
jgi:hypothetical protein